MHCRCVLSAIVILSCAPGIDALGVGWYFTVLSLILFVSRITMAVELKYGPKWRLERLEREKCKYADNDSVSTATNNESQL